MTPHRQLTYTQHGPTTPADPDLKVGDVLASSRSFYLVHFARKMRTRDGARRFACMVERTANPPADARRLSLKWNSRAPKRRGRASGPSAPPG